jgi:hypothetical protein
MSDNLVPLNRETHRDLRVLPPTDLSFARDLHVCPLHWKEIPKAARAFPIVFPPAESSVIIPQALLSLTPGGNNLVDDAGRWLGPYLPVHLRRHPFYLGRDAERDEATILVDESSNRLSRESGDSLFEERDGEVVPAPALEQVRATLLSFDAEHQKTMIICERLKTTGVLLDGRLNLTVDGEQKSVGGFSAVDWQRVLDLDDATLADWTRVGLIEMIINHRYSLQAFERAGASS